MRLLKRKYRGYLIAPVAILLAVAGIRYHLGVVRPLQDDLEASRVEFSEHLADKTEQNNVLRDELADLEKSKITDIYPTAEPYIDWILQYGEEYDVEPLWLARIQHCESRGNPRAVNLGSQASGLYQFMPSTWLSTPFGDENIFNPESAIKAAAWMASEGRQREWVCN